MKLLGLGLITYRENTQSFGKIEVNKTPLNQNERVFPLNSILPESSTYENQVKTTAHRFLNQIGISKIMRKCNFNKAKGPAPFQILSFIFMLVFTGKNLYRTNKMYPDNMPFGKDTVYRFLNNCHYNWKKLLLLLAQRTILQHLFHLTSKDRVNVLIIDDSMFSRNRSKAVELLSRFRDHTLNQYIKGFRMLTLGWSDGKSFVPLSFTLLAAEEKKQLCKVNPAIDKRTNGYKRRTEAVQKSTDALLELLEQAKPYGFPANYLLFDSWFSFPSVIVKVRRYGLHTICMLKDLPRILYDFQGSRLNLGKLYQKVKKKDCKKGVFASVIVNLNCKEHEPVPARIIFVKDRTHRKEWLALLSTDIDLPEEEIIRTYGKRWDIEMFFKTTKSFLKLSKEFQGQSFDSMVAHTSIVFIRYIMLCMESRYSIDDRSKGEIFYLCCDEIKDITFKEALLRIMVALKDFLQKLPFLSNKVVDGLLSQFFDSLPCHIKAGLTFSLCES